MRKEFCTYAVITDEGKWYDMGEMGWWMSTRIIEKEKNWRKAYRNRFIKGLLEDTLLTVVDCHI